MPEPLKNLYSTTLINNLGNRIVDHYASFDKKAFKKSVFDKSWKEKELKQRMRHIAQCLHRHLPNDYKKSIKILKPVSTHFSGFEYMFFQDYVECYGLEDFETSMLALEHFTKYSSSEFAVRAFILQDEKRMMKQMAHWARSDNHHVRRLACEGCRPRLPWAISLPMFKKDPKPVLAILKILMKDDSEYVRRSVANNLNDISKDNAATVLQWAHRWLGHNKETDWIIKHACRSLFRQGDTRALSLFGFAGAEHIKLDKLEVQREVSLGKKIYFSFLLKSKNAQLGRCRIEFAIDFMKANGKQNRKVFKISEGDYLKKEKSIDKHFSFKKISTRKYYAGKHRVTIIVNGVDQAYKTFNLVL